MRSHRRVAPPPRLRRSIDTNFADRAQDNCSHPGLQLVSAGSSVPLPACARRKHEHLPSSEAQTRTSFRIVAVAVPAPLTLVALSVKLAESCRPRLRAADGSCTVSFSATPDEACPVTALIRNVFGFVPFLPFAACGRCHLAGQLHLSRLIARDGQLQRPWLEVAMRLARFDGHTIADCMQRARRRTMGASDRRRGLRRHRSRTSPSRSGWSSSRPRNVARPRAAAPAPTGERRARRRARAQRHLRSRRVRARTCPWTRDSGGTAPHACRTRTRRHPP